MLLDPNEAAFGIIPVVSGEAIPQTEAVPMGSIVWLQGKDGEYIYATIQDPVGAHFAVMPG